MAYINGSKSDQDSEASDKIVTVPNVLSIIRLCLVPVYLVLLILEYDIAAIVVFIIAAASDCIDGQVARRTNDVSKLGQVLDPTVDRILIIVGVIGLVIVGRVPIWIFVLLIARDFLMLCIGGNLMRKYQIRIPVIFVGKVATACLFTGFVIQLLNWPIVPGLGLFDISWLPGWGSLATPVGIWFIYVALILLVFSTVHYASYALNKWREVTRSA